MMILKYVLRHSVLHSFAESPHKFLRFAPVVKVLVTGGNVFLSKKIGTNVSLELSASLGFLKNNLLGLDVNEK